MRLPHTIPHTRQALRLISCILFISAVSIGMYYKTSRIPPACSHCNVIILVVDILRADKLSCYGSIRNTSPNICHFAQKNIFFPNAFSASTTTLPSEVSFFTSLYPSQHRIDNPMTDFISPDKPILSTMFRKGGYKTILIGNTKQDHLPINIGLKQSFDTIISTEQGTIESEVNEWIKTLSAIPSHSNHPSFIYIYTSQMDTYNTSDTLPLKKSPFDLNFSPPYIDTTQFTKQTWDNAIITITYNLFRKTGTMKDADYKTILTSLTNATTLKDAKSAFLSLSQNDQHAIFRLQLSRIFNISNPQEIRYVQNMYDDRIALIDDKLQTFLQYFESNKNLYENTILLITSDHGENLGEHNNIGHGGQPYDSLTHVPLIMHVPTKSQKTINSFVQQIDLFPTLLHMTGLPIPSGISGFDISSAIYNNQLVAPRGTYAISEINNGLDQAIRTKEWRLVINNTFHNHWIEKLYSESQDANEENNVANIYLETTTNLTNILQSKTSFNNN